MKDNQEIPELEDADKDNPIELPSDIVRMINSFLPLEESRNFLLVSKQWNESVNDRIKFLASNPKPLLAMFSKLFLTTNPDFSPSVNELNRKNLKWFNGCQRAREFLLWFRQTPSYSELVNKVAERKLQSDKQLLSNDELICYALTTDDIKTIPKEKLEKALQEKKDSYLSARDSTASEIAKIQSLCEAIENPEKSSEYADYQTQIKCYQNKIVSIQEQQNLLETLDVTLLSANTNVPAVREKLLELENRQVNVLYFSNEGSKLVSAFYPETIQLPDSIEYRPLTFYLVPDEEIIRFYRRESDRLYAKLMDQNNPMGENEQKIQAINSLLEFSLEIKDKEVAKQILRDACHHPLFQSAIKPNLVQAFMKFFPNKVNDGIDYLTGNQYQKMLLKGIEEIDKRAYRRGLD